MGRDQMRQQETWQGQGQTGHEGQWGQHEEDQWSQWDGQGQGRWNQSGRQMTTGGQTDPTSTGRSGGEGQWQGYVVPYRYYGPGYAGTGYYAVYYQGQPGQDDRAMSGSGMSGSGRWGQGQDSGMGQARRGGFAGRGPQGYRRSDQRIEEEINDRLTDHDDLDASNLQAKVRDGIATLTGTVESRSDKRLAADIVEHVPGVRDVMNQITVSSAGTSSWGNQGTLSGSEEQGKTRSSSGASTTAPRQPAGAGTASNGS
jgi:osmotically-inducible protein OsmY